MTTNSAENYYQILGVRKNASAEEIKRAYKNKAKIIHPDRNKSPDAHEQFILLTEAYEYLINPKPEKVKFNSRTTSQPDWQNIKREQARARAQKYAQMQYEEFIKSDYYKSLTSLETILHHLYLIVAFCILLVLPLLATIIIGLKGFIGSLLVIFITLPITRNAFKNSSSINPRDFFNSLLHIAKTKTFLYVVITAVNLYLFFAFTLNTQVPTFVLLFSLSLLFLSAYVNFKLKILNTGTISQKTIMLCVLPGLFNIFFTINYIFSSNPSTEKYFFVHDKAWYGQRQQRQDKTGYIFLENNKYSNYHWFRMYFNYESMKDKSEITYTFEEGLFGLRVLKAYEFTK